MSAVEDVEDVEDVDEESSASAVSTVDNEESDISDIEEQGYCDDSTTDNVRLVMKLEPIRENKIKKLYKNTEKVRKILISLLDERS